MTTSTKALIERTALALYQAKTTLDERGEPLYKPGKRLIEHCSFIEKDIASKSKPKPGKTAVKETVETGLEQLVAV